MSAPIPSFFKIRVGLVILLTLLFFMLLGMAKQVFAMTYSVTGSSQYLTAQAASAACSNGGHHHCDGLVGAGTYGDGAIYSSYPFYIGYDGGPVAWTCYLYQVNPDAEEPDPCDDCPDNPDVDTKHQAYVGMSSDNAAYGGWWTCLSISQGELCSVQSTTCDGNSTIYNTGGVSDEELTSCCEVAEPAHECTSTADGKRDSDGDGVADIYDMDDDNDGISDARDDDDDGDGVPDAVENGSDTDGDGEPDITDRDDDNDGVDDIDDSCPRDPSPSCKDSDHDGNSDDIDNDDDNDGIPDDQDNCPTNPRPDCKSDSDGDGTPDDQDPCPNDASSDCTGEKAKTKKYIPEEPAYEHESDIGERFGNRFKQFIAEIRGTSIFSISGQIFGNLPTGGNAIFTIDGGQTFGQQEFSMSSWSPGLAALRGILYILAAWAAVKIALLGK